MRFRSSFVIVASLAAVSSSFGQKGAPVFRPAVQSVVRPAAATAPIVLAPEKQGQWQGGAFISTVAPNMNYNPLLSAPVSQVPASNSTSVTTANSSKPTQAPASGGHASSGNGGANWSGVLNSWSSALSQWGAYSAGNSRLGSSAVAADPDATRYQVNLGQYQTAQGTLALEPIPPVPGGLLGADVSIGPAPPGFGAGTLSAEERESCDVGEVCDPNGHVVDHGYENPDPEDILQRMNEDNANTEVAALQLPSPFFSDIFGSGDYVINPEDFQTAFGWMGDAWASAFSGLGFGESGYFEQYDPEFSFDFLDYGAGGFGSDDSGFDN